MSAFANLYAPARGTYDLEEAAPRPTEHRLGRAAYRSRSASRVAVHEVGVATGRSDGRTFPTVIEGEMRKKRTSDSFSVALRRRLPPVLDERPYRPNVRRQGPSSVDYCPSPPYVCRTFVRPNVPSLRMRWTLAGASISFGRSDGRTLDIRVGGCGAPRALRTFIAGHGVCGP